MDLCLLVDVYSARKSIVAATALFLLAGCTTTSPMPKQAAIAPPIEVLRELPSSAPIPTRDAISIALSPLISSPRLGNHVGVAVADALSGAMIYQSSANAETDQFIPASAIKLFTAVAVLFQNNPENTVRFKGKDFSLSDLVEMTLTESDNTGARLLSTLVPGPVLSEISRSLPELDLQMTTMDDPSGLSRKDRTTPTTLVHLLLAITDLKHPELSPIISGLPITGFSGTLKSRAIAAIGQIRAKTGTLTGVDVLAGYLVDKANRALVFAIMADRVPKTESARKVIDQLAIALLHVA